MVHSGPLWEKISDCLLLSSVETLCVGFNVTGADTLKLIYSAFKGNSISHQPVTHAQPVHIM